MSFLNFNRNVSEAPQRGRTLKEISYQPSDVESREPLFRNGPNKVKIKGRYGFIYEDMGCEFSSAREAVNFWIEHQGRYLRENVDYIPLETFTRRRTRAEKAADVKKVIDCIKESYLSLFSAALSRSGPWDEKLHDASSYSMEAHEKKAVEDLQERLVKAAGSEFQLLALSLICPQILKDAVSKLDEGQTVEAFHEEQRESAARSKTFMGNQIREARAFLENLPRDE